MLFNWGLTNGVVIGISTEDAFLINEGNIEGTCPCIHVFLTIFRLTIVFD